MRYIGHDLWADHTARDQADEVFLDSAAEGIPRDAQAENTAYSPHIDGSGFDSQLGNTPIEEALQLNSVRAERIAGVVPGLTVGV